MNAAQVSGSTVTLSWTPGGGGAATSYALTARLPNGVMLGPVPFTATSASFAGVPPGTYVVSVVALNAGGTSAASNQVTVVVP